MADKSSRKEATPSIEVSDTRPVTTVEDAGEELQRPSGRLGDESDWGEDTVVLGIGGATPTDIPAAPGSRREALGRARAVAVLVIGCVLLGVILISGVIGKDSGQRSGAVAPSMNSTQVKRGSEARSVREAKRRTERTGRSKESARELRRGQKGQRQNRKEAKSRARSAPESRPAPQGLPEAEPEYVPEYSPEPVPAPPPPSHAAPPVQGSTPPGVEFGM